jgi:hypothetical protein
MKRATTEVQRQPAAGRSRGFFKRDYPRPIDRYIDYFGGPTVDPSSEVLPDGFGDLMNEGARAAAHG